MSEMELLKRIEALESKVADLETALNTISMIDKSERISDYLKNRQRSQSLVSLVNSMTDEEIVISSAESEKTKRLEEERNRLERQIKEAIARENTVTNQSAENEQLFSIVNYPSYVEITGYNGFNAKTIVVPPKINGKTVLKIGDSAFKNTSCEHIVLPELVTEIGDNAFSESKQLKSIELGNQIRVIGKYAFSGCLALKNIVLPEALSQIGMCCFYRSGIEKIIIPGSLQIIPYGCFSSCSKLREIIISEGVKTIEKNVFAGDFRNKNQLHEIIIPKSMVTVNFELYGSFSNKDCKLVFLGEYTDWKTDNSITLARHIVYCTFGSKILQSSRQLGCEVHPLSEYFENK